MGRVPVCFAAGVVGGAGGTSGRNTPLELGSGDMVFCRKDLRVEDCGGATGVLGMLSYASSSVQPWREETDDFGGEAEVFF